MSIIKCNDGIKLLQYGFTESRWLVENGKRRKLLSPTGAEFPN